MKHRGARFKGDQDTLPAVASVRSRSAAPEGDRGHAGPHPSYNPYALLQALIDSSNPGPDRPGFFLRLTTRPDWPRLATES